MKFSFKYFAAPLFLLILIAATFSACRKTPVKKPGPIGGTPTPPGNWQRVAALPDGRMRVIEVANGTFYAASELDVVYSTTDGLHWTASTPIDRAGAITAVTVFNNKLYAGTELYGIFVSDNGGQTWVNSNASLRSASSFAVLNNTLYSGSSEVDGIAVLDDASGHWNPFKSGLPTNYNLDVQKLVPVINTLFSVQGVNGNYYTYDKTAQTWHEQYFFGSTYTPGLRITDMIYDSSILFAADNDAVLISDRTGAAWSLDTVGLKKGPNPFERRALYAGADFYYTLNYSEGKGTWVQKKHRPLPSASWAANEEFLPDVHGYSIREFKGMVFMGTDSGVYWEAIR
ncbi:MAG: hypothetical protein V4577_24025 [Bacteroidota bacterium]